MQTGISPVTKKSFTKTKIRKKVKEVVLKAIGEDLLQAMKENGGRKPYGYVSQVVEEMKEHYPWITRHIINHAVDKLEKKHKREEEEKRKAQEEEKKGTEIVTPVRQTSANKTYIAILVSQAKDDITIDYKAEVNRCRSLGKNVRRGFLKELIEQKKLDYDIPASEMIYASTIRARLKRGEKREQRKKNQEEKQEQNQDDGAKEEEAEEESPEESGEESGEEEQQLIEDEQEQQIQEEELNNKEEKPSLVRSSIQF